MDWLTEELKKKQARMPASDPSFGQKQNWSQQEEVPIEWESDAGDIPIEWEPEDVKNLFEPKQWVGQSFTPADYAEAAKAGGKAVRGFLTEDLPRAAVESLPAAGTAAGAMIGTAGTAFTGPGSVYGGLIGAGLGKAAGTAAKNVLAPVVSGEEKKGYPQTFIEPAVSIPTGAAEQAAGEVFGKALGGFADWRARIAADKAARVKPNIEQIKESAKAFGEKPTAGMLTHDPQTQWLENSLENSPTLAGESVRKAKGRLYEKMGSGVRGLFNEAGDLERSEAADGIKTKLIETIRGRLAPLTAKYKEFGIHTPNIIVDPKAMARVSRNIVNHPYASDAGSDANKMANQFATWMQKDGATVSDVMRWQSKAKSVLRDPSASNETKQMAYEIVSRLNRLQSNSIGRAVIDTAGKRNAGIAKKFIGEIKETNAGYRALMESLEEFGGKGAGGAKLKFETPQQIIDAIDNIESPQLVEKLFQTKNVNQLKIIQKHFPEEFELLRAAKLADLQRGIVQENGMIDYGALIRATRDMEPTTREMLFGDDGAKTLEHIIRLRKETPGLVNPSGTARAIEGQATILDPRWWPQELNRAYQRRLLYRDLGKPIENAAKTAARSGLMRSPEVRGLLGGIVTEANPAMISNKVRRGLLGD